MTLDMSPTLSGPSFAKCWGLPRDLASIISTGGCMPYQVDRNRSGQGWGGADGNIWTLSGRRQELHSDSEVYRAKL